MYTILFKISNPSHYNDGDNSIITLLPQLTWKYLCTVFITILLACSDIMFSHHQQLGRHTQCMCNACRYSPWTKSMHGSYGTLYRSHYTAIYKPMVTVTYTLFLGPAFKQTSLEMQSCKFSGCWVNYYDKGNHVSNHHLPALYSDECSLLHLCTFYMYCYLGLA